METPRSGQATVTLRDVAHGSGVSITTVSRILNGRESGVPIREETRERVLARRRRAGLQAEPARPRPARQPQLAAGRHRPRHLATRSTSRSCAASTTHRRGARLPALPRPRRLPPGRRALAYGSMFERSHADGIILIGDIDGGDAALDLLAQQHRYVVGVTDRTDPPPDPGRLRGQRGRHPARDSSISGSSAIARSCACRTPARTTVACASTCYEQFMRERGVADQIERVHHRPGARAEPRARSPRLRRLARPEARRRRSTPRPTRPRSA